MAFTDRIVRWVRETLGPDLRRNINRLLERPFRRRLPDTTRGPVQGTRGEAGQAIVVTPEPPTEQPVEGLYGQPYPGNPHPDPGALWFESGGSWTGLLYPDWQDDFPHPPGVLAGNVFFESSVGHLISWHWYPSGGPPGNAIKYLQVPNDFNAWAREEQQAAAPGGYLSREVLHVGKRLYYMPDHWACIGACWADDWLFLVGLNWSGRGRNWTWSGYSVDVTGTCNAATTLAVWVKSNPAATPDTIFSVGMSVRLGAEERVIQTFLQSGGPDCWLIRLDAALSAVPDPGTPIEIVKPGGAFGGYTTRVFAVRTVTNTEGDLEVVPGSTLYDLADLTRTDWTQQFLGHPDGRNMVGLQLSAISGGYQRDIHRLAFDTGPTPPTVNHTVEARTEKRDEIYLDAIDEPRVVHSCSESDVPGVQRDLVVGSTGCFTCDTDNNKDYHVAYDAVYSGQDEITTSFDIEDKMGRKIQADYKSRTLAVDYDAAGNELVATLEIDFESTITVRTTNNYSNIRSLSGTLSINPYCQGTAVWYTNSGQYTQITDEQSTLLAERHLETDLSIYIAVNGQKKLTLGSVQDDLTWSNTADTRSAYDTFTEVFEGINWNDITPAPPGAPVCGTPPDDRTFYDQPGATQRVSDQRSKEGTIVGDVSCVDVPSFDYEFYPIDPVAYDIRNIATPLLFMDLRSGVYVTQGREGIIDDIYGLPESQGNPTFADRQMYPYTVEDANYVPVGPIANPEDYDQHWAAWGVDFAAAGAVGSPAPVWLVITQFDQKGPNDLTNPINWSPWDFIKTNTAETPGQGAAQRAGRRLVNVYVQLPTVGQETLQAVELRNPTGDPLTLIGIPGADKITNIGAV